LVAAYCQLPPFARDGAGDGLVLSGQAIENESHAVDRFLARFSQESLRFWA
jgi:hypothetical protein